MIPNVKLCYFYPRPPGGGRRVLLCVVILLYDFYPRPPGGGRPAYEDTSVEARRFLSTPSGWRATPPRKKALCPATDFYPRPPGGGRLFDLREPIAAPEIFLSTPSGWRATSCRNITCSIHKFLSTPSGWRATKTCHICIRIDQISIHALRVEGDSKNGQSFRLFLRKREKNLPL